VVNGKSIFCVQALYWYMILYLLMMDKIVKRKIACWYGEVILVLSTFILINFLFHALCN
jgi:hypothetical protein